MIKAGFSKQAGVSIERCPLTSASRLKHRESNIWQRRFWERQIRDQEDFSRHVDYIHWNPVKHGLAERAVDWPYSSFRRFLKEGIYSADWGAGQAIFRKQDFGNVA